MTIEPRSSDRGTRRPRVQSLRGRLDVPGDAYTEDPVSVRSIYKSFDGQPVLSGITLGFPSNSVTTILGPSGTGKSVLLKHVVGLLDPDAGEVSVFGEDMVSLKESDRAQLRKRFGVLFQDGALFGSMSVYDNVAFPLRRHTNMAEDSIQDVVNARLDEVGLREASGRAPSEISGGMKKRAGFARALVMNPEVVLFDEPDSGLDPVRTSLLNDLIVDMHGTHSGTYVLVTHDIETARKVSDYVGLIWRGEMVHYGPAESAFSSDDPFVRQFLSGSSAGPLGMD